jgi:hypothetical protein
MSDGDLPLWAGVGLIVLTVALWLTIVLFGLWRWRAWRRGEGFVVEMRDDYRGGLPEGVFQRMKSADGWLRSHPILPALWSGGITGFMLASLFSLWVGIIGGAVLFVVDWSWGRRRRRGAVAAGSPQPSEGEG